MSDLKTELKKLIIKTLDLEDITSEEIISNEPLFVEGLGLDSIDALEIGVALQQKYSINLGSKGEDLKEHFYSIDTIATYIQRSLKA